MFGDQLNNTYILYKRTHQQTKSIAAQQCIKLDSILKNKSNKSNKIKANEYIN